MLVAPHGGRDGRRVGRLGSDAIAGVVNVILDTQLEGFKAQIDYGETDGKRRRRHARVVRLRHGVRRRRPRPCAHSAASFSSKTRSGLSQNSRLVRGSLEPRHECGLRSGNGLPNFVVGPDTKFPTTENGEIAPCLTRRERGHAAPAQQTFNRPARRSARSIPGRFPGLFGRRAATAPARVRHIEHPAGHRALFLARPRDLRLSDRLEFFAEVAYASSDAVSFPANGGLGPATARILGDNAFLSPAVRTTLPEGGVLSRIFVPDVISARNTTENETTRFVTGLEGEFGDEVELGHVLPAR